MEKFKLDTSPHPVVKAAQSAVEAGDYKRAVALLDEIIKHPPFQNDNNLIEAVGNLAEMAHIHLLNQPPFRAVFYFNRGIIKTQYLEQHQDALKDLNEAIKAYNRYELAYHWRGTVKSILGDKEGALKDYNTANELDPNWADNYYWRAIVKNDLGDEEGALKDYEKAIELEPDNSFFIKERGLFNIDRTGKYDYKDGLPYLNKAIELDPDDGETYYWRAFSKCGLLGTKEVPENEKSLLDILFDLNKAIELNPNDVDALSFRAYFKAEKMKDIKGATEDQIKGLEIGKSFDGTFWQPDHIIFENFYYETKNKDIILKYYDTAVTVSPNWAYNYFERAHIKSIIGDLDGALKDLDQAVKLDPEYSRAYYLLGKIKYDLGDKKGALKDFDSAIKRPDSEIFNKLYLSRAKLNIELARYEEALADVRKVLEEIQVSGLKEIKRIEIKRLWGKYDIDFSPNADVTVLAGDNGSGKSTLLRLIIGVLTGDFPTSTQHAQIGYIRLTFDNGFSFGLSGKEIENLRSLNASEINEENIHNLYQEINKDKDVLLATNYLLALLKQQNYYLRSDLLSGWTLAYLLPVFVVDTFDPDLKPRETIQKVSAPWVQTELDFEIYRLQDKYKDYRIRIGERANRALQALIKNPQAEVKDEAATQTLFFNMLEEFFTATNKRIIQNETNLAFFQDGITLTPDKLSTGEKQLLILLLTALIQDNKPCVFLLDEPENSLHPDWQGKLIRYLRKLNPNAQIIAATHSPDMIDEGLFDKLAQMKNISKRITA